MWFVVFVIKISFILYCFCIYSSVGDDTDCINDVLCDVFSVSDSLLRTISCSSVSVCNCFLTCQRERSVFFSKMEITICNDAGTDSAI